MLTSGDGALAERARSERNQGRGQDMAEMVHTRLGFNYRLSDVAAAIGVAQVERAEQILARREQVAALYRERLEGIEGLELPAESHGSVRRSWFVFTVQLPERLERDAVVARLAAEGIQSKAYLPCIHLQPLYRERFGFRGGEFPVAERYAARSLALPFFNTISEEEVDRVCAVLRELSGG
jgi:perosamine synthetase